MEKVPKRDEKPYLSFDSFLDSAFPTKRTRIKSFWCPHGSGEKPTDLRHGRGISVFVCDNCGEYGEDNICAYCEICYKHWHVGCVPSSLEDINHPYHPYHPLKLLIDGPPEYSNGKCSTCDKELKKFFYHCSICDYNMNVKCSKNPPPPVLDAPKCHEHTLTRMARNDRFTCNACGTHGEQCPYVCATCSLMFHQDCIALPHVININRHEDRISHTYSLGFGDRKCLICHKMIDWRYGAYSCVKCPSYVVHSKCATRDDVWDGVELEGVPEELFDVSPFKVIEEGVINHFSHEKHNMRIVEDGIERDKCVCCEACVHPIFTEKHYKCMECNYTLHETCANLPLRKRHGLSPTPLTLVSTKKDDRDGNFFTCYACNTASNGFRYDNGGIALDVRCAMVSHYCDYECHPHTLFLTTIDDGTCGGCHKDNVFVLNCVECEYAMCFKCATLPKKIKNRSDDHFLVLHFGEKAKGKYWCEVCETVLDPQNWFYTCDDCVVVCHIECVLGDFVNAKPGVMRMNNRVEVMSSEGKYEEKWLKDCVMTMKLVSNDSMSRPNCSLCRCRCLFPFVIKDYAFGIEEVFCKFKCLGSKSY